MGHIRRHVHAPPPPGGCARHAFNATTSTIAVRACFRPVLAPEKSAFEGRQALIPLPSSGLAECCFADPLGECRRDTNTLAPNGSKARILRCARQELVRVPKSNTKYGGHRGKTGGKPAPVVETSISESSGFPTEKICIRRCCTCFIPLFTGQVFFWPSGLRKRTHVVVRKVRAGMPAAVVVRGPNPRQAGREILPDYPHARFNSAGSATAHRPGRPDVPRHHLDRLGLQLARDQVPAGRAAAAHLARGDRRARGGAAGGARPGPRRPPEGSGCDLAAALDRCRPQRHRLDGADGARAALAAGERGGADRLHHAGLGLADRLARARRAADPAAHDRAGDGVRGARLDHGRQRLCRERSETARHHHGAGRCRRLCARHGAA